MGVIYGGVRIYDVAATYMQWTQYTHTLLGDR